MVRKHKREREREGEREGERERGRERERESTDIVVVALSKCQYTESGFVKHTDPLFIVVLLTVMPPALGSLGFVVLYFKFSRWTVWMVTEKKYASPAPLLK